MGSHGSKMHKGIHKQAEETTNLEKMKKIVNIITYQKKGSKEVFKSIRHAFNVDF